MLNNEPYILVYCIGKSLYCIERRRVIGNSEVDQRGALCRLCRLAGCAGCSDCSGCFLFQSYKTQRKDKNLTIPRIYR